MLLLLFITFIFLLFSRLNSHIIFFFFFNDTATTEIYTLSLHDALPISCGLQWNYSTYHTHDRLHHLGSEEHTSELQSPTNLVCRLLLEKKKQKDRTVSVAQRGTAYSRAAKEVRKP